MEAIDGIEAAEIPDAREITQYVKCKVSYSAKVLKKLKTLGKKLKITLHLVHSNFFYQNMILHF